MAGLGEIGLLGLDETIVTEIKSCQEKWTMALDNFQMKKAEFVKQKNMMEKSKSPVAMFAAPLLIPAAIGVAKGAAATVKTAMLVKKVWDWLF